MKMKLIITGFILSLLCTGAFALSYSVYTQPDTDSQSIGIINEDSHIVPIYRQGNWIKIGSEQTGQIGWVNTQEPMAEDNLNNIQSQRQQLLAVHDKFMRDFNQAMASLDRQEHAMTPKTQDIPAMPFAPAMQSQTYGVVLNTNVTLHCKDGKGVKTVHESWVDQNGKRHSKHYTQNITC